jgi:hypothetical protein
MKAPTSDSLKRNLALLREVADQLGVRTKPFNLHDSQVSRSPLDLEAFERNDIVPPDRFIRKLQCVIDGNRALIRVNDEYVVIEISGCFGRNIVCSFNEDVGWLRHLGTLTLAPAALASLYACPIFLLSNEATCDALSLLRKAAIRKHIRELSLGIGESLHILGGQVILYLKRYKRDEVLDALKILTMFVNDLPKVREKATNLKDLPAEFHDLIPLILRWGITDDEIRNEVLCRASRVTRSHLVDQVAPYFGAINRYLDSFGNKRLPEYAVLLGALAECASEVMNSIKR